MPGTTAQQGSSADHALDEELASLLTRLGGNAGALTERGFEGFKSEVARLLEPHFEKCERAAGLSQPNADFRNAIALAITNCILWNTEHTLECYPADRLSRIASDTRSIAQLCRSLQKSLKGLGAVERSAICAEKWERLLGNADLLDIIAERSSILSDYFTRGNSEGCQTDKGGRPKRTAFAQLLIDLKYAFQIAATTSPPAGSESASNRRHRPAPSFHALVEKVVAVALKFTGAQPRGPADFLNSPDARRRFAQRLFQEKSNDKTPPHSD